MKSKRFTRSREANIAIWHVSFSRVGGPRAHVLMSGALDDIQDVMRAVANEESVMGLATELYTDEWWDDRTSAGELYRQTVAYFEARKRGERPEAHPGNPG